MEIIKKILVYAFFFFTLLGLVGGAYVMYQGAGKQIQPPIERVDELFAGQSSNGNFSVLVARNKERRGENKFVLYEKNFSDSGQVQTQYAIGDLGWQFYILAALHLHDQNRFSLDDSLGTHLPELSDELKSRTITHVLEHSTGLRDDSDVLHPIRQATFYAHKNNQLLKQVLQNVIGGDVEAFIQKEIIDPLEMKETTYVEDQGWLSSPRDLLTFEDCLISGRYIKLKTLLRWFSNVTLANGESVPTGFSFTFSNFGGYRLEQSLPLENKATLIRIPDRIFTIIILRDGPGPEMSNEQLAKEISHIYLLREIRRGLRYKKEDPRWVSPRERPKSVE